MNLKLFSDLVERVPQHLNRSIKKEPITKQDRSEVIKRDNYSCSICGLKGKYGNPHFGISGKLSIHHIIPNGKSKLDNLITLCEYCHAALHLLLYRSGKWRYVPLIISNRVELKDEVNKL